MLGEGGRISAKQGRNPRYRIEEEGFKLDTMMLQAASGRLEGGGAGRPT